jgi:hypothetical protein
VIDDCKMRDFSFDSKVATTNENVGFIFCSDIDLIVNNVFTRISYGKMFKF